MSSTTDATVTFVQRTCACAGRTGASVHASTRLLRAAPRLPKQATLPQAPAARHCTPLSAMCQRSALHSRQRRRAPHAPPRQKVPATSVSSSAAARIPPVHVTAANCGKLHGAAALSVQSLFPVPIAAGGRRFPFRQRQPAGEANPPSIYTFELPSSRFQCIYKEGPSEC